MQIELYVDEMYPVYDWFENLHEKPWGKVVEVPDELFSKYERIKKEYDWMQEELEKLYH